MINQPISQLSGLSFLRDHLEGLITTTSANAYWKDASGKYLGANQWQVTRSGAVSQDNLLGATDYDLAWKAYANDLIKNDRQVITNKQTSIFIEPVKTIGAMSEATICVANYLSYKSPLLNRDGKAIGIFGLSYLLNDQQCHEEILNEISMFAGEYGALRVKNLLLRYQQTTRRLTLRQLDCLHLLAKGMTMKQIAHDLSLSRRTVEHYIEAIKSKLHCTSRSELIMKALELGLLEIN